MGMRTGVALGLALMVAGCNGGPGLVGSREIQPPRKGIYVGGLYYADEKPTPKLSKPVTINTLCTVSRDLAEFGVPKPSEDASVDIDLLSNRKFSASLSGIKTKIIDLGLSGNVSDYYEYKITNVTFYDIPATSATAVFKGLMNRRDCRAEFAAQGGERAVYQVKSVYVGDIIFTRKNNLNLDATVAARLSKLEPQIKAALSRDYNLVFSGKGMVFSFVPILRNGAGS